MGRLSLHLLGIIAISSEKPKAAPELFTLGPLIRTRIVNARANLRMDFFEEGFAKKFHAVEGKAMFEQVETAAQTDGRELFG